MIVRTRVVFFGVSRIFEAVLHRLVVVLMFENELLVIDLEAAEIVLVVRIVVRREIGERSCELKRLSPDLIRQAFTAAVNITRPPVNDLRESDR